MDGVTLKEETKMKPALFAVPALFVLFPAAIGFGIAEAIHRGTGFSGYCNVIDSDIKDRSLYWLYLAVVLFAWTTRWLNSFPMGLKNAAVESHGKMAKGNVRANMYLYQNLEGGLVVLEEDGAAGQYNRVLIDAGADMAGLPRRIVKETSRLMSEPPPGISATPYEDNLRYFNVIIAGPAQSPYEGGIFKLELFLPAEYPMVPPKVRFLTKIYHPNIDKLGRICLDILKDKWSPALQIRTVLLSIQALMSAPNPDDPLANDVADHWKAAESDALAKAKEWTQKHAYMR